MHKLLFICHGNICRSPMAEFIMKDLLEKKDLSSLFEVASAATSSEELGNPVYPPAKRLLNEHGIDCSGKRACRLNKTDYDKYDLLIIMDLENKRYMSRLFPDDSSKKIHLLREYCGDDKEIDDPWYTGDFEGVYRQIKEGCEALLDTLMNEKQMP
ncbi:MAG: low molecular weight phosphotyrosine protein phosphatase [Erysipelotrichaceae bacterium]|nr:low molecular weight phosphotyrosine protein phosphatase [Erysipelotrichaceae bacterium]